MSHPEHGYHIKDLPQAEIILDLLQKAGDYATINGHRITTHPGPFNVLCSPHENVVSKTIFRLSSHSLYCCIFSSPLVPHLDKHNLT